MKSRIIKIVLVLIGLIFIFGLSWVKLWFAALGFLLIICLLFYELCILVFCK